MQAAHPEKAGKLRALAAELRGHAAKTQDPDYQDKFQRTADELEDQAERLEHPINKLSS